jgi:Bacterial extracellular solute-binding protein
MTRGVRTGVLVGVAIAVAAACMIGLSAEAVANRAACSGGYTRVGVAASDDLAPAIQKIASSFNKTRARADGLCVRVTVTAAESNVTAEEIDGQPADSASAGSKGQTSKDTTPHLPSGIDAWIPDSSLWVDVVRGTAQGAMTVQPGTTASVAKSPLVVVTTHAVASESQAFAGPVSWAILLPPGFGGPPSILKLTVALPDPAISAVGLATAIEVTRQISTFSNARSVFTNFENDSDTTDLNTDSVAALANFVATNVSQHRNGVTVASEQAVLAYDKVHPDAPLVARYPTGMSSELGSPELDYPYVLTSSTPAEVQAAGDFGKFLQSGYAQSVVRYYGFRSADGLADTMPSSDQLSSQPLQVATPASASDEATTLEVWTKLALGSRDIVLLDVSAAMDAPSGLPGVSLEDELSVTAEGGLSHFPASTQMGLWLVGAKGSSPRQPAQQMILLGGLDQEYGLTTRKQQLLGIDSQLPVVPKGNMLLYDSIWNAFQKMTATYSPTSGNAVVVLTAGVDGKGDMPLSELLAKLKALYNPSKKVEVFILMFGTSGNFRAMQEIAHAAGGQAYPVASPSQVQRIFDEAWSQILCEQRCTTP